jgi:hypothetical protein
MRRFFQWFGSWHPVLHGVAVVAVPVCVMMALTATTPLDAVIPVPRSRWLAQCSALPVDTTAGITVERVRVRPRRVTALLRAGKRRGWLQAHRLGTLSGSGVWAVRGPTALRNRMALSPECSGANGRVIPWTSAKDLPPAAKAWIAARATCCGEATYKGRTYRAWPCARGLPVSPQYREGFAVVRLDGYGPPVVGSKGACSEYAQENQ